MKSKSCTKCKKVKPYIEFYPLGRGKNPNGPRNICKVCARASRRKRWKKNPRPHQGDAEWVTSGDSSVKFPERELLCAIIDKAVLDWRKAKKAERILELHTFFTSGWYSELCLLLDLEPNAILKEIGIGFRHKVADKPPINEDQVYA